MNDKEIREIRRRFKPEKSMISAVYGCYVNDAHNIVASFEEFLSGMPIEQAESFLGLLKKSLCGALGKNLINMDFPAREVMESESYKLLFALRASRLKDAEALQSFYERVIASLNIEGGYLILLAQDVYAVPYRGKDNIAQMDASDEEFSYIVCSICPVKFVPAELSYQSAENSFRSVSPGNVASAPVLGFMFPAFDDRATNLYGALYYAKSPANNYPEFADAIFHVAPPMPAAAQKETFELLLSETLGEECSLEVVQTVHGQISDMIAVNKDAQTEEPISLSGRDVSATLRACGVSDERAEAFSASFDAQFGADAELPPANVIDKKQFVIHTPDALIKVDAQKSGLIEARVIDGSRYILIPADGDVQVNGVSIHIGEE